MHCVSFPSICTCTGCCHSTIIVEIGAIKLIAKMNRNKKLDIRRDYKKFRESKNRSKDKDREMTSYLEYGSF